MNTAKLRQSAWPLTRAAIVAASLLAAWTAACVCFWSACRCAEWLGWLK